MSTTNGIAGPSSPAASSSLTVEPDTGPAGALEPAKLFDGVQLLILGGTGFLGKLFWVMLLTRYPNVGKIHLLVRSSKHKTSAERFWSEIATSEALLPLREQHGDRFADFLREKIVPIDGDVSRPCCGVDASVIEQLRGKLGAVVNVAGVVDFNPPLDEAIDANAGGAKNLVALCRALGDTPLYHTSTCYVVGNRKGLIHEALPTSVPFPRAAELGAELWDPEREIADCMDIVREVRNRENDGFRQSEFLERAKNNLDQRGEPREGEALEKEVAKERRKFVSKRLVEAGIERAKHWGWPNVYTYTKSIGEQIIEKSGLRFLVARPACCESTTEFPFPGWNEGIGTSAPIIYLVMKGHHQIVGRDAIIDFVPSDIVCVGMILALAELLEGTNKPVYQFGASDVNPATSERFGELIGLYKRKSFSRLGKGNPIVNKLQAYFEPAVVSSDRFVRVGPKQIANAALGAAGVFGKIAPLAKLSAPLRKLAEQEKRIHDIISLFLPFTYDQKGPFSCANSRAAFARLSDEDKAKLPWYPERIDWAHYWMEQHMPAMEFRVIPWLDERWKREAKPQMAHENLLTMVDQMADRHGFALAFSRMEDTGWSRITYYDVARLSRGVAKLLQDRGIQKNDVIAIAGQNHPAWPIVYFGILRAGAIACPIDPGIEASAFANIVSEGNVKLAMWDQDVAKRVQDACSSLPCLDLQEALALADSAGACTPVAIHPTDVASLIFTSGTTGKPKGVRLSHANFTSLTAQLAPLFQIGRSDRVLSVLPLHHTFEFSCGLLLPFSRGARIHYIGEITGDRLSLALKESKVTALVGVPAVWQVLERRILAEVEKKGPLAESLFGLGTELNRLSQKTLGLNLGKTLFGSVHQRLGGSVRVLISGGAALPPETQKLFTGVGLRLTEGYGLTEASPVLTVAKPGTPAGQVGKPIPGVEIRIDAPGEDGVGEVLARGPNVMLGYTDDAATREVLEDGWLRTGDLGKFDRKGHLVLVGRSKDVIVTATGENLYPDDLERMVGHVEHIEELAFLGVEAAGGGERLACVAVPKEDASLVRAERNDRAEKSLRKALGALPFGKQPQLVQLFEAPLPRTATKKVKRGEVRAQLQRLQAAQKRPEADTGSKSQVRVAISAVRGIPEGDIHATSTLQGDLGIDSLALTELLVALEAKFGTLDTKELSACVTVADVESLVHVTATPSLRPSVQESRYAIQGRHSESLFSLPSSVGDVVLPETLQERGKQAIGKLQDFFYGEMMRSRVIGASNIPHNRNVLVVANHASHLDMGFVRHALGKFGEEIVSLAAQDYFFDREPWKKAFFANFSNLQAIDRKGGLRATERRAKEIIESGRTMLIFPEGTRSPDGQILEFKPLIGHLALHYNVDILPVYLGGTHAAMPKGARLPSKRELEARIGPVFSVADMKRLTAHVSPQEASREIAKLARLAVLALKEGDVLDFATMKLEDASAADTREHPLVLLFRELHGKFAPDAVKNPVSFYFTLGQDERSKWTVLVDKQRCDILQGKPQSGTADCVLKTSPEVFTRIVREGYIPGASEFMTGLVKSNDIGLLLEFQRVFQLGEAQS